MAATSSLANQILWRAIPRRRGRGTGVHSPGDPSAGLQLVQPIGPHDLAGLYSFSDRRDVALGRGYHDRTARYGLVGLNHINVVALLRALDGSGRQQHRVVKRS